MTTFTILRYHLDVLAFLLVLLAGGWGAHWFVRRATRNVGLGRAGWAALAVVAVGGAALCMASGRLESARLQQMVGGFAPTYAEEAARLGLARVTPDTPADDPTYLALIDAQLRWLRYNPFAADIYTFGRRADGRVVLLVDSETDYDGDGRIEGARESRTPIGEPYDQDAALLGRAFAGETVVFTKQPTTDRWGVWMSAYAPVRGDGGRVIGVLGIDHPADAWVANLLLYRFGALALAVTVAAVLTGMFATTAVVRSEAEKRAAIHRRAATHDSLTGLPNRVLFYDRLAAAVAAARRRDGKSPGAGERVGVLFLDFDRFKWVNDTMGHAAGDLLLTGIANRLRAALRTTDDVLPPDEPRAAVAAPAHVPTVPTAARLGGDEFCVLLPGLRADADAAAVAARLLGVLAEPYTINGRQVCSTASIGVAVGPVGDERPERLLQNADAAMYQAKAAGKARYVVYGQPVAVPPQATSGPLPSAA